MSKQNEIKKLRKRIEELEFVKDFQQDIIADMEIITGVDISKKSLLKTVADEIELKNKNRLRESGSISVSGFVNKPSIKNLRQVKEYRTIVGSKTGGVKLYTELKNNLITNDINLGRDYFYRFLRYYNLLIPRRKNYHVTTNSKHQFRKYKNLVKDQVPTKPKQL